MLLNPSIQKLDSLTSGIESIINDLVNTVDEKMNQLNNSIASMHSEISEHGAKDWHIAYHQQPHEKRDLVERAPR